MKHKRTDFKPRNDDLSFARVNTEPCIACCETLERVRDAAKTNLSGKNLEVFLTEIGVAFHGLVSIRLHDPHFSYVMSVVYYWTIFGNFLSVRLEVLC